MIVPMLCVGTPHRTLRAQPYCDDAERRRLHSHAERGNDQKREMPFAGKRFAHRLRSDRESGSDAITVGAGLARESASPRNKSLPDTTTRQNGMNPAFFFACPVAVRGLS